MDLEIEWVGELSCSLLKDIQQIISIVMMMLEQ